MAKLVVNPGTPQAWEIQLKPGTNHLGRGITNDFKVNDLSVSGSHCQIVLSNGAAVIKDLGSTNGTFVNRSPVQEARLETGHTVRLGSVDMIFYSDGSESVVVTEVRPSAPQVSVVAPPLPAAAPPPMPVASAAAPRPAVAGPAHAAVAAPPLVAPPMPAMPGDTEFTPQPIAASGPRFCKFHPKSPARFLCQKCNRSFCDLCVTNRVEGGRNKKMCRSCAVECTPLQVQYTRPVERGFFSRLPGAFVWPFLSFGSVILIAGTIVHALLSAVSVASIFVAAAKWTLTGFMILCMQNIIHITASDEKDPLSLPDASGIIGAILQLGLTILISFCLPIALVIARLFDIEIPPSAIIAATLFSCLYFPMAFLAVAMKDTALSANPLVVIPAILKIPLEYIVTAILLMVIYGFWQLGNIFGVGSISITTREMGTLFTGFVMKILWTFVTVYLVTVNMRILGLLYVSKKDKLAWF